MDEKRVLSKEEKRLLKRNGEQIRLGKWFASKHSEMTEEDALLYFLGHYGRAYRELHR